MSDIMQHQLPMKANPFFWESKASTGIRRAVCWWLVVLLFRLHIDQTYFMDRDTGSCTGYRNRYLVEMRTPPVSNPIVDLRRKVSH